MNRDETLLDLELRLLVARHGKAQIAKTLSAIGDVDVTLVDSGVKAYEDNAGRNRARRRPRKSVEDMMRGISLEDPDTAVLVERLARAYEEKDFLPEFRDVRRFLESRRISTAKLRSRADALPTVVRELARFSLDELQTLDERRLDRGSDLGIIADQILGPPK